MTTDMRKTLPTLLFAALLSGALPPALAAQQSRADSLAAELRRLRARMDSLEALVARLARQGRDTAQAGDELARLREAARAAAGQPDTTTAARRAETQGRRSLNDLNPEVTVTGDVRLQTDPDARYQDNVVFREVELSFQAALDPYASTKIFFAFEEDEIHLEEAYLYWTGLPGNLRVDLGRLRQQAGELNRWHLHALPESEYPLVHRTYFGEEGLASDGIRAYWLAPTGGALGVQELTLEGTLGGNEILFDGGNRPSILGHLNNFFALSPAAFFQVGGTALYGENPEADVATTLFGADVRFTWRPPAQAQYRSFTLRGEGFFVDKEIAGAGDYVFGGYVGAQYQLSRRWFAGARYDYVEPVGGGDATWAVVPHLTWWQSEWAFLHAEWQHQQVPVAPGVREGQNLLLLQVVWAIGPHKHETY